MPTPKSSHAPLRQAQHESSTRPLLSDGRLVEAVVDRRGFLTAAGASTLGALLLAACGGDSGSPVGPGGGAGGGAGGGGAGGGLPPGVDAVGNTLRVNLAVATALQSANGFLIVSQPPAIVVNIGSNDFRAFTAVCTHSGCLVGGFANGRITCPCHGSQFDVQGRVVRGPAPSPLRAFATAFDGSSNILTITIT